MAMTYDSVVQATRKKFLNTDVSSVQGTLAFQINLIGKVEGIFYIEIKDGQVHVEPYEYYDRNAILTFKLAFTLSQLSSASLVLFATASPKT